MFHTKEVLIRIFLYEVTLYRAGSKKGLVSMGKLEKKVLLLFFLSGTTGLVYEVLWSKLLAFVFGNSTSATAAVLAVFMGGLALGSYIAGSIVPRLRRLIFSYGVIEGAIGLYCLALPWLISQMRPILALAYDESGPSTAFGLIRLLLVSGLLLLPATLMGMTFPLLGAYFERHSKKAGRMLALLYGINCSGAVLGALGASFVLIPTLGLFGSTLATSLANIFILISAMQTEEAKTGASKADSAPCKKQSHALDGLRAIHQGLLFVFALAGFASMVCQVAWTRVFSLLFGSSVYTFSIVLSAFIAGLALGSFLISKRLDTLRRPMALMAKLELGIALACFGITALMAWAPLAANLAYPSLIELPYSLICFIQFLSVSLLILLPTTLMGMLMPLVSHFLAKESQEPGKAIGRVFASNTLGCIVGSLAGGFLLIPFAGLRHSLLLAASLNLVLAAFLWILDAGFTRKRLLIPSFSLALLCLMCPSWNQALLSSGPYVYAKLYQRLAKEKGMDMSEVIRDQGEIVFHEEGSSSVVTVRKYSDGSKSLHVNGKTDASSHLDMKTQVLVAHLPSLLAESLDDVMAVGLGCGASLGAFQTHSCEQIDCLEISPEIVRAAEHFKEETKHSLGDPRVRMVIDDARTYLSLNDRIYDVIMSEPSNPWVAGMTYLFTKEYFELCRSRLKEEGIMCQWVHAYSMSQEDFCSVMETFQSVFPRTSLWYSNGRADYIILGHMGEGKIPWQRVKERFEKEEVKSSLAAVGIDSAQSLLDHFIGSSESMARLAEEGGMITDDNLRLEYTAPFNLFSSKEGEILSLVSEVTKAQALPSLFTGTAVELYAQARQKEAHAEVLVKEASSLIDRQDLSGALEKLEESISLAPTKKMNRRAYEALLFLMGRRSYARADYSGAAKHFADLLGSNPEHADGYNNLGNCFAKVGSYKKAKRCYATALSIHPTHQKSLKNIAVVCSKLGENERAIKAFEKVVQMGKGTVAIQNNLALLYVKRGKLEKAEEAWKKVLQIDPLCKAARNNLARLEKMTRAG